MGFYTTASECECREKTRASAAKPSGEDAPPSKNRVWDFSTPSPICTRQSASQVPAPHREKRPTPTITVSGVRYYGYRYLHTELGWLNRDPIEESGGVNLYAIANNNASVLFDMLGLYQLDLVPSDISSVEGWSYTYASDMKIWGSAIPASGVDCKCNPSCSMQCTVMVHYGPIVLSDRLKNGAVIEETTQGSSGSRTVIISDKTVYGHEQLHITAFIQAVKNGDPSAFFDAITTAEAEVCNSMEECQRKAIENSWKFTVGLVLQVDPGHDPLRGGPVDRTPYPPIGGVFPKSPK